MGVSLSYPFTLQNATTADATQVQANFDAVIAALANAAADGANNDITSLLALSTPISPTQGGSSVYIGGTSGGTANAQTVTISTPTGFALTSGMRLTFLAGFTNTGALTLNVNGTGVKNVFRQTPSDASACVGGEVVAGVKIEVQYDGTQFQLLNSPAQFGGFGPPVIIASATTTDLTAAVNHNANLTGTATITGFGTPTVTTYPIWNLFFSGAMVLTHSANLICPGQANITTVAGDTAQAAYLGGGIWAIIDYQRLSGRPVKNVTPPTVQDLLSGTAATYTTPAGATRLWIRMVAGGGGTQAGGTGGTTSFNSITAIGGQTNSTVTGGIGGTGGAGAANLRIPGGRGGFGQSINGADPSAGGAGGGGQAAFFCGGAPGGSTAGAAVAGITNTGGGASGVPGAGAGANGNGGGGAGEYVEFFINGPLAATYTYTVGAGGTAGTGAIGGSGRITVTEFYD